MWTITQLKSNVSHRCSFHLIDRIALHEEHCYIPSHTVYRLSSARFAHERRQGNTFTSVAYRFSNTNEVELIFRADERTRRSPFRNRDAACIVFTVAKLERLPIARYYSNYHRRTSRERIKEQGEREMQKRAGWGRPLFPLRGYTSDINSHESVTEAICRARRTGRRQLWSVANS